MQATVVCPLFFAKGFLNEDILLIFFITRKLIKDWLCECYIRIFSSLILINLIVSVISYFYQGLLALGNVKRAEIEI